MRPALVEDGRSPATFELFFCNRLRDFLFLHLNHQLNELSMNKSPKQLLLTTLALCALLLPTTASAKTKTPFTTTETTTVVDPGKWITDGTSLFVIGQKMSGTENASDPRLCGTETIRADVIMDLATGTMKYWGTYHLENAKGAWDGYWYGEPSTGTGVCTTVGSGGYAGLVARWTAASHGHWTGYIVENGPGEVPMKVSGSRNEQFEWSVGAMLDPSTMQPTGEFAPIGKVTLVNGEGVATHTGKTTDLVEVGIVTFPKNPTTAAWSCFGILRAANGDLLNWVAMGENDLIAGVNTGTVHFAGGTGRFDAATGSFGVPSGIGTIRY